MTDKKFRLNDSKVFCMAPWVSINNNPNGNILPCCISQFHKPFGNLYENPIEEIWNNEKYKELRKNMLEEKETPTCERCYKEDAWGVASYRHYWNNLYSSLYKDLVEESTSPDGYLSKMNFYRWDFRFNNLCNLACIGCSSELSSSWVEINKRMWGESKEEKIFSSRENKESFINTIKTQIQYVDNIYFAGGEPLMHAEHYEIMEELDKHNKLDKVDFIYSTNLTNLNYKNYNIIDYWKKMKKCKVLVSLDEVDPERLHYIRYPSDFNKIVDNIKIINQTMNTVEKHWSITPTWTLLNLHRIKDVTEFFYKNDLLPNSFYESVSWDTDTNNIILLHPRHLSISIATPEWKEYLVTKLDEFEEWYRDELIPLKKPGVRPFALKILEGNMNRYKRALEETNNETVYKNWYYRLDVARGTDFKKTFPELAWHYDRLT